MNLISKICTPLMAAALSIGLVGGASAQDDKPVYWWIASLSTLPLFLSVDHPALEREAERLGVTIKFGGPETIDIAAENNILEQVAAQEPDGILFMPFGEGHNETINSVIAAGIPLITIDGDAPNSNRMGFVGTNWFELGRIQARVMADLIGGSGEIMLSAIIPNDNTRKARIGIEEELAKFPDITILGLQNDKGDVAETASLTAAALQANPNIAGFIGIDAASGPGIARAVIEAGLVGSVKIVSVNNSPDVLESIRDGVIDATLVQKREAFNTWALRMLDEIARGTDPMMRRFTDQGFPMIPTESLTGVVVVTNENIDKLF